MSEVKDTGSGLFMSHRIEALSAMTIMVLDLKIPEHVKNAPGKMLHEILLDQSDLFFNYCLSFLLLAMFWLINTQQFHRIRNTNRTHLWINIVPHRFREGSRAILRHSLSLP